MSIEVAKTAGFCFGVNRAVQMVYDLIEAGESISHPGADYPQSPAGGGTGAKRAWRPLLRPEEAAETQGGDPFPWRSPERL